MRKDIYESPLSSRYASEYMLHLFSPDMRFQTSVSYTHLTLPTN